MSRIAGETILQFAGVDGLEINQEDDGFIVGSDSSTFITRH